MRMAMLALAGAMVLAACGDGKSAAEKAAEEAMDIAAVEEANRGFEEPFNPQPILYPDIEANQLYGVSCAFAEEGGGIASIMIAMMEDGYMKFDGKIERFAADMGSPELAYGARAKYTGKKYALELALTKAEGQPVAAEAVNYDGRLTVRDPAGRIVYDRPGAVQCGS